jgi:hypothetical protein
MHIFYMIRGTYPGPYYIPSHSIHRTDKCTVHTYGTLVRSSDFDTLQPRFPRSESAFLMMHARNWLRMPLVGFYTERDMRYISYVDEI